MSGDGPEGGCRSCPVCQGLAVLREVDPDAVNRVELAAAGLLTAVRELFVGAAAPSPARPWHPPAASGTVAWQSIEIEG